MREVINAASAAAADRTPDIVTQLAVLRLLRLRVYLGLTLFMYYCVLHIMRCFCVVTAPTTSSPTSSPTTANPTPAPVTVGKSACMIVTST
jgi:hypothetical protein